MSLSRRFQNLIAYNRFTGAKSLFSVDLTRQLFGNTATRLSAIEDSSEPAVVEHSSAHAGNQKNKHAAAALKMGRIRLASPILTFQSFSSALDDEPCKIKCFPFVDRKMIWADQLRHPFVFDAETRQVDILPNNTHKTKLMPFSLVVPNINAAAADDDHTDTGTRLYIVERITKPEGNCITDWSNQFEVFIYREHTIDNYLEPWQFQLLPPPPYVRQPRYWEGCSQHEISSYAVFGIRNTFHICISVKGIGSYCLDTASHTWRKVGNWTLPFHGRGEYVPELKLWFGLTEEAGHLAAADLSTIDYSQPQLVGYWKQQLCMPEEWKECKDSQLVNLGSGRFCITRFFNACDVDENIAVFTGVEVVPHVDANARSGEVKLHMIPHKSLCHRSTGVIIDAVF